MWYKILKYFPVLRHKGWVCLWLYTCVLSAQVGQPKAINQEDYKLWYNLHLTAMNSDGTWVAYTNHYDQEQDTLWVQHIQKGTKMPFPSTKKCDFIGNQLLITLSKNNQALITNLNNGTQSLVNHVMTLETTPDKLWGVLRLKASENESLFLFVDQYNNQWITKESATAWAYNKTNNSMAYTNNKHDSTEIITITPKYKTHKSLLILSDFNSLGLSFDTNGQGLLCVGKQPTNLEESLSLEYIQLQNLERYRLTNQHPALKKAKATITPLNHGQWVVSDARILFGWKTKNMQRQPHQEVVKIWEADTPQFSPVSNLLKQMNNASSTVLWEPLSQKIIPLTDTLNTNIWLSANLNGVLVAQPDKYFDPTKHIQPTDGYTIDLKTNKKTEVFNRHSIAANHLLWSPSGKYLLYFKDKHWHLFNTLNKTHTNLTAGTSVVWHQTAYEKEAVDQPFGCALWQEATHKIWLYDKHHIWECDYKTLKCKQLTPKIRAHTTFRVLNTAQNYNRHRWMHGVTTPVMTADEALVILSNDNKTKENALFLYHKNKCIQITPFENYRYEFVTKALNNNTFCYTIQNDTTPPKLMTFNRQSLKPKLLFESNPHHKNWSWPKSERLRYTNASGDSLSAILYRPADWNPDKKYPLIVNIYEDQTFEKLKFTIPRIANSRGFNKTHWANQDYMLLYPEIKYTLGETGQSALECTVAAVTAAKEKMNIDPKRIGIYGHSFGGYQVNYIITQTDIFAAAVSGAAVSNTLSMYLTPNWDFNRIENWKFENNQFRMGMSLFENPEVYLKNSPIIFAHQIKTPLLSWTGEDDKHVNTSQSFEFFAALRRNHKVHKLLVYPNEKHALVGKKAQENLSLQIKWWFDKYLKEE